MKAIISIVLTCCLCLSGTSLAFAKETDPYEQLWPRIDGSTATLPLTEAIMMDRLGLDVVQVSGRIVHNKTYEAYERLLNGEKDLIFVPMPEQQELDKIIDTIAERKLKYEGTLFKVPELEYYQVVKEALVFITNTANPVQMLTTEQLKRIYKGEVTNWSEVGGADMHILPFQRNSDSGSQTAFLELLMQREEPMSAVGSLTYDSMWYLVEGVSAYDNRESAIGYTMYFYVTQMYGKDNLRLMAVDGINPSEKTIASGAYSLVTGYYAVVRHDLPKEHPARKMVAWLLSKEGQQVAKNAGYVPLAVE